MSDDCVFCGIVAGRVPTAKVMEDEATLAFIPLAPATEGHTLVVPKRHSRNIFDIASADLERTILMTKSIALRQRERLGCAGVSLFQANEPAGFQTVFHFHLHVVPRYAGDRVREAWHSDPADLAELERIARRLRDQETS
ncbi:MAG TPA: HIT domain-containing protein [Verrucomicrobiae bacterium]|nr:HIT domain-containing protein [Verrucomicrobiae bacterium]